MSESYDSLRLKAELAAAGLELGGIYEGVPYGGSGPAWVAICAAHIEDESTWLETDLNTHAAAVQAVLTSEQWQAYWGVQTARIDALNVELIMKPGGYGETFLLNVCNDVNFLQSQVAAVGKKAELLLSYPGTYS